MISPTIAVLAKAHALDHLAIAHVEAGNYAFGKNGRSSSMGMRSSSSALPLIAAAAPHSGQSAQIARIAYAAGCLPGDAAESAARPPHTARHSGPSVRRRGPTSVQSTCLRPGAGNAARASHSGQLGCRCHPWVATRGVPSGRGARRRRGRCARDRNARASSAPPPDRSSAALPITARAAPASSIALDVAAGAQAAAHLQLEARFAASSAMSGAVARPLPSRAPSRSTTCSQSAPMARYLRASSARGRRVARSRAAKSPRSRRTQRPSFKSMAGIRRMAASGVRLGSANAEEISQADARRPRRSAPDEIARRRNCARRRRR